LEEFGDLLSEQAFGSFDARRRTTKGDALPIIAFRSIGQPPTCAEAAVQNFARTFDPSALILAMI